MYINESSSSYYHFSRNVLEYKKPVTLGFKTSHYLHCPLWHTNAILINPSPTPSPFLTAPG